MDFILRVLDSSGGGALIGAAAALVAALLTARNERKRYEKELEHGRYQNLSDALRELLPDLLALELDTRKWMRELDQENLDHPIPQERIGKLRIQVGVLTDARVRLPLERALGVLDDVNIASQWGTVSGHPVYVRGKVATAMIGVAMAASRGDELPASAVERIDQADAEVQEGLSELNHWWEKEHGKG